MEVPYQPGLSSTTSRAILGLLSAIGVLVGIVYGSIRSDTFAIAADVIALRHSLAEVEARQRVAEERSTEADKGISEIQRRLQLIDGKLTAISEQVAVLADRAGRSGGGRIVLPGGTTTK